MAYEKQEWKCGEVVTADKLNHMEDGIASGGGVFIIDIDPVSGKSTTTWQEVHDALANKIPVCAIASSEVGLMSTDVCYPVMMAMSSEGQYGVYMLTVDIITATTKIEGLKADSADGYLYAVQGN